jgi:hypothetical protein
MENLKEYKTIQYSNLEYEDEKYIEDGNKFLEEFKKNNPNAVNIKLTYEAIDNNPQTLDNPLTDTPAKSTFMLNSKKPEYYIRFGYLLDYIKKNILPRVKVGDDHDANPPIFKIDTDPWDNYMYSLPNQISLDPRVCIIRNSNFISGRGTVKAFHELWVFKPVDGKNSKSKNYNVAYPMNIYLNFNFVLESLQLDDRGDVNLFEFISNICTGLNKALGGINNLEPIIDESSNTLKIIDTTPIPGLSENSSASSYILQLYGYDKIGSNYISNFIRKVDLKTAITPEYATMITVGATAGGYVKGTESTAFSKWNTGLRDRFKEDFTPGNIESVKPDNGVDEAESNYVNRFLSGGYINRYGFSDLPPHSFSLVDDIIEGNISIVTEYYKYLLSKEKSTSGGTIGFIPFKLSMAMDGISGIKIYNKLNVNTEFLPKAYGKNMDLIITGVSHKLSNNDWETDLETTVIPKSGELSVVPIAPSTIQNSINNVNQNSKPSNWPFYSNSDAVPPEVAPPSKNTPPNYNTSVSFSPAVKTKYYPELLKIKGKTKGLRMLALVMTQKEGFNPGTKSYRTNNPGNIGNTDSGNTSSFPTLKAGIEKQLSYLYSVAIGTNKNYPVGKFKDVKPFYSIDIAKAQKSYQLTPYLPGYKFTPYTGTLEQFVKIYSTGARSGNSYLSIIISFFRKNGFNNVTEKTTLSELINLNNPSNIIL